VSGERELELRPAHLRALLSLAEARQLTRFLADARGPDYLWPGFGFARIPILIYEAVGDPAARKPAEEFDVFLVQHADPPAEFSPVDVPVPGLEDALLFHYRGPAAYLPAVRTIVLAGRRTAALPLGVFRQSLSPEAMVGGLVHDAFHAFAAAAGLGQTRVDPGRISRYPELSPVNNVLGNIEGRLLYGYVSTALGPAGAGARAEDRPASGPTAGAGGDPVRFAYDFCLVRRERRGPLEDDVIDYEQELELTEGPARYVRLRCLLAAAASACSGEADGYRPGKAFSVLSGRHAYSRAPSLVEEELSKLPGVNVEAAGSAWWRFYVTGMALCFLADELDPAWKVRVSAGETLDAILERLVTYGGEAEDEARLDVLRERYGYDGRLEAERVFSRSEMQRKKELLAGLLEGGDGMRLTFDVSELVPEEDWWESGHVVFNWDPSALETVTRSVRIHGRGLRFRGFGTDLEFTGVPVLEDQKSRLFHVKLPDEVNLKLEGDGREVALGKGAVFEDGLELELPGVRARARSGYVQDAGGTLYVKITR